MDRAPGRRHDAGICPLSGIEAEMTDETSGAIEARIIEAIRKRRSNVYDCHGEAVCEQGFSDIYMLLATLAASEGRVTAVEVQKELGYPLEYVFTFIVRCNFEVK